MMNTKILQRMIWKDVRAVVPLAVAVSSGLVAMGIVQWVFYNTSQVRPRDQIAIMYAIWMLIPNLFALGAPAMLVGGEEESGALRWLRTLPVDWRDICRSKTVVAFCGWLIMLSLSTLVFFLLYSTLASTQIAQLEAAGLAPDYLDLHLFGHVVFGSALLFVSFASAYFFRSPVSGLVAVAPLMVLLSIGFLAFGDQLSRSGFSQSPWSQLWSDHPVVVVLIGGVFVFLLFVVQQLFARRRLCGVERTIAIQTAPERVSDAFRPPRTLTSWYAVALAQKAPSRLHALLWQMMRQSAIALGCAAFLILGGALLLLVDEGPLASIMIAIAFMLVGGISFYGDSVRNRCAFLYDRGVSPSLVWATRVVPAAITCLVATLFLLVGVWVFVGLNRDEWFVALAVSLVFFSLAQLVSLWSPRPVLVFFAAPVLFTLGALLQGPLLTFYPWAISVLWVLVPIFLIASWMLTPRWLAGAIDRLTSIKLACVLLVACSIPYVVTIGGRWATMPAARPQWREMMMSMPLGTGRETAAPLQIDSPKFVATVDQMRDMTWNLYDEPDDAPLMERLRDEIRDTEVVGRYVLIDELTQLSRLLGAYETELVVADLEGWVESDERPEPFVPTREETLRARDRDLLVAKALAKYSRIVREKAINGEKDYFEVQAADLADRRFAAIVDYYLDQEDEELQQPFGQLASLTITPELRKRSRVAGMVNLWRAYRSDPDRNEFLFQVKSRPEFWMGVERMRIDRYVDEVTRLVVDQEQSGDRFRSNAVRQELFEACTECVQHAPRGNDWKQWRFTSDLARKWTDDQEYRRMSNRLKSAFASE